MKKKKGMECVGLWSAWKGHGVMDGASAGGGGGGGGAEEASGERTAAELGPSLLCFRRDWASLSELLLT